MGKVLGAGLGVAAMLCARIAGADPGVWTEGEAEVGYLTGAYELNGQDTRLSGQAFVLGGALGFSPSKLWAVGGGADLTIVNTGHEETLGGTISAAWAASLGLEGAIRPTGNGLLVRPSVSYQWMSFSAGQDFNANGGAEVYFVEAVSGPRVGLALGWTGALVGATLGASYSHLSGDYSTFRPIVIGVELVFHYWGST